MHARIGWQNLRTSEFLDAGDYMLITGTDFEDGKVNYSTCHYVEKERYDQDKNIQIKNGNILITKDGTLGKVAYVEGLSLPATLNAGVFNVEVKDENETDSKYLFQFLKAPFLMDYVSKKATGGTIKHLNQNILVDFPIATPSKAEQVRIGEYFSNLDNLITLHQRISLYFFKINTFVWEQRRLGEVCQITMGQSPDGSTYSEEPSDYILVQGNADLKDGWVEPRIWTTQKTKTAQAGDLIMSVRAPAGAMGKTAYDVVLGRGVAGIKGNEFVYQSLVKMDSDGYWKKMAAGSTFESINSDVVKNAEMSLPQDVEEQEKIGSYFMSLDYLITLHQRKPYFWNKFIVIDWEQRKFGEITELKSASRVHKDEWTSNGVPFYRSSDVMAAINGTENEKAYISEELYEKLSKVSGKLEEGDILVTGGGSVGNPYIVPDNKPLYTKDADLLWIKNKGKFHPYFLYEFFFSPTFRNYLGSISHVGTIAHYTITQLSDTPICLPSFEEQKEVGEYFQSLDNLITLHHHKLFVINGTKLFTVIQCKY